MYNAIAKERFEVVDRTEDYRMIDTLRIENFRCFKSLELSGLRRINVIVGQNASGKTAFLESVKLALDASPSDLPWLNNNRGIPLVLPGNPTPEQFQAIFADFFHDFNLQTPISTAVLDSAHREATLRVFFDPSRAVTTQPRLGFQQPGNPPQPPITVVPLVFERTDFQGQSSAPSVRIDPIQGQLFLEPAKPMGIVSGLISSSSYGNPGENAQWLSKLSVQKRSEEVVEALRRHFPFIRQITSENIFGFPSIYADISDVPRKLPLSLVSSGISRLLTFILAIVEFKNGVVLIDEIENGIFHDQYSRLWQTLADLADRYDTQLFVSTHSKECLKEAVPIIAKQSSDFSLLRLRRDGPQSHVEFFGGEQMEAALQMNGEVRDQ